MAEDNETIFHFYHRHYHHHHYHHHHHHHHCHPHRHHCHHHQRLQDKFSRNARATIKEGKGRQTMKQLERAKTSCATGPCKSWKQKYIYVFINPRYKYKIQDTNLNEKGRLQTMKHLERAKTPCALY